MTLMIADGFDFYSTITDMAYVGSAWAQGFDVVNVTPYNVGQAANLNVVGAPQSNILSNEPTIYLAFTHRYSTNFTGTASGGMFITLMDAAANQVTLQWAADGNFYVRAGGTGGTILNPGGWPHGMAIQSWCHWQVKVTINNTTGSVELRKNNNPVNDLTLTGLNTRNGSTNNYANKISFGEAAPGLWYMDDFFMNSASGAAPNSWPGQLRAVQLMPNADTAQKDMTASAGATTVIGTNSTLGSASFSANFVYFAQPVFAAVGGTVSKVTLKLNAAATGHVKCAIYTSVGGAPGTLVAQTVEVTNPVLGDNDFTFTTPPALADGASYWMAFWSDVVLVPNNGNSAGNNYSYGITYGTTFPSTPLSPVAAFQNNISIRVTINVGNYGMVNEPIFSADTDYVFSSTVGATDLYDLTDLAVIPSSIPLVVVRHSLRKSDTGARSGTTQVKTGATVQDQTPFALATTYGWQMTYMPVDPNTAAAWTTAGVNALKVGPKVAA